MYESYAKILDTALRSQKMSWLVAGIISARAHHRYVINGRQALTSLTCLDPGASIAAVAKHVYDPVEEA